MSFYRAIITSTRFCARASWVLLITTMSTSYWVTHLHIGVPLKTRLHELKGKKFQMKIVCSFLILSLGPKKYSYSYTEVSRLPEESVAWIWSLVDSSKSLNEGWSSSMLSRNELWGDVPLKLSPGSTSWLSIWKISGRRSSGFVIGASLLSEFWLKSLFHDNHEVKKTRAVKRAVLNSPSAVSLPLNDCPAKITTIVKNMRARKLSTQFLRKDWCMLSSHCVCLTTT